MFAPGCIGAMTIAVLLLVSAASPAAANWLSKLGRAAEHAPHAGSKLAKTGIGALDNAAAHIAGLPPKSTGVSSLAAHVSQEGHWTFANPAGERFTAANAAELARGLAILAPDAAKDAGKLAVFLTEDSIFTQRARLADLPRGATLNVVVGREAFALVSHGAGTATRTYAQLRPNLLVDAADPRAFHEAVFQLARSVDQSAIRMLAVEPGGPATLSASPRLDAAMKRALVDVVDPAHLTASFAKIKRQTALLSGRVEGDRLFVKPSTGAELNLSMRELTAAAEAADVNLIVLRSAAARQPGGRNWLWQRIEVRGLDSALAQPTLADVFNALAGSSNRFVVSTRPSGTLRTTLDVRPARELPGGASIADRWGEAVADLVSELAGKVISEGATADVASADRRRELDDRIIPGVPSSVQWTYIVSLLLGLFGLPVARRWWLRLWPIESRAEYANAFGYWSARAVRGLVFLAGFVPLASPLTASMQALVKLWEVLTLPLRAWRWIAARR